jgi:octaprenyl-diphosphate synthase
MEVIYRKTAKLFEAGLRVGPILTDRPDWEEALALYGSHLGAAFQLVDDALDYMGDPETLGKNVGDDLAEGKPTLPLIHVLHQGKEADRALIRKAIESEDGTQYLNEVIEVIKRSGALDYTLQRAREEADEAKKQLSVVPASPYRDALAALADLAVQRDH